MNVLVACEESQRVATAFRERGHNAYSCDILPCSGGHPEYHIKSNIFDVLNPSTHWDFLFTEDGETPEWCGIEFNTMDGAYHRVAGEWDLIIAHPPCTYLTVTGNRWFNVERYGDAARDRIQKRKDAIAFFMAFVNARCERIAIENPVGIISTTYRKPDQIIQPYYFGDPFEKKTCLWLKGLPKLFPTNILKPPPRKEFPSGKTMPLWYAELWNRSKDERARERSKTFWGFARAMAEQWG